MSWYSNFVSENAEYHHLLHIWGKYMYPWNTKTDFVLINIRKNDNKKTKTNNDCNIHKFS
jgi:hypothetical protein